MLDYGQVYWSVKIDPVYLIKFFAITDYYNYSFIDCCNKLANFGTNTHKPELYLFLFGHYLFILLLSMEFEKWPKDTQVCVYLWQNSLITLSQQYKYCINARKKHSWFKNRKLVTQKIFANDKSF